MRYERMLADPVSEIRNLAKALRLEIAPEQATQVSAAIDAIKAPSDQPVGAGTYHDSKSFLHPGQIGDKSNQVAMDYLHPDILNMTADRYQEWLIKHNYIEKI